MPRPTARVFALILAAAVALGLTLGTAVPAMACSCIQPQPMAAYKGDPDQVVFTGFVQAPDGRGVPVTVSHWFQGPNPAATVWLAREGFGPDGASCGTAIPPAGTEWIFVAYRTDGPDLGVNLCSPHAAASSAEGQSMFAEAVAVFGPGLEAVSPSPPPVDPTVSDGAAAPIPTAVVLLLAVAIAGLLGGALLSRRGRRGPDEPAA